MFLWVNELSRSYPVPDAVPLAACAGEPAGTETAAGDPGAMGTAVAAEERLAAAWTGADAAGEPAAGEPAGEEPEAAGAETGAPTTPGAAGTLAAGEPAAGEPAGDEPAAAGTETGVPTTPAAARTLAADGATVMVE